MELNLISKADFVLGTANFRKLALAWMTQR